MNKVIVLLLATLIFTDCRNQPTYQIAEWHSYDETEMLSSVVDHDNPRMRLKLVQSKVSDKNKIWDDIRDDLSTFSEEEYLRLYPLIHEQDITSLQKSVREGELTYETLVQWYLYRIVKYENDSTTTLHTIIALNPNALEEARLRDAGQGDHPIYGMPILLKDNINTSGMNTTAGAIALQDNQTDDAHIVKNLRRNGAIILGKANLSEWAYFFCGGCPVGYSAVGGQTLNPYGRGIYETGGSSSGSGTSTSANYAVGAVGTETSGSILSPSSKNSVVGLKPTIGLLSRSGIVPISSTLDTPGPMTKNVSDNAILLSAMAGADPSDDATEGKNRNVDYLSELSKGSLKNKRLGVIKRFLEDSLYKESLEILSEAGAILVEYEALQIRLDGFGVLLSADMQRDLPHYLDNYGGDQVKVSSVQDVVSFNEVDTTIRAPYGQARLIGSAGDETPDDELAKLAKMLNRRGIKYFDTPMTEHRLDAVLSIDNFSAGFAAVAKYPCLTVPMGYRDNGSPTNLTFVGRPESEAQLLQLGYQFEKVSKKRRPPF